MKNEESELLSNETNKVEDAKVDTSNVDVKVEEKTEDKAEEKKGVTDETIVFDKSLNFLNTNTGSVTDDTLVNFNWTDAKIEALKEQINALTSGTDYSTTPLVENKFDFKKEETPILENKIENKLEDKIENNLSDLDNKLENKVENKIEESKTTEIKPVERPLERMGLVKQPPVSLTEKKSESSFEEMYEKMFGTSISKSKEEEPKVEEDKGGYKLTDEELKTAKNISLFSNKETFSVPVYKYIGLVFDSNIIIEYENEMYIIDQRVANERILFEKIKKNYYSEGEKDSQLMLLPDIIELSHKQMGIAKDNLNLFKKAGFDLEVFGENTIKLTGVPSMCIDLDTRQLFIDTLEEINTVARTATKEIEEKFIETVSRKTAVKAPFSKTEAEVNCLLQNLLVLDNPFTCAGGNQAAIRMSKADIEKKFSRR